MPNQATDWVQEAIAEAHADLGREVTERAAIVKELLTWMADTIYVLKERDGVNITREMCVERARNGIGSLIHNYEIARIK